MGMVTELNEIALARFRAQIMAQLQELRETGAAGQAARAVVELDQQSVGRLSRMDALQNQAMAKAQQARREVEALRLTRALARIEAGEYGYCDSCGDDLPEGRLSLDPAATRCVSCARG
ncbi:TraR/DksA C4-type zinc finger protein [Ruegeria pomeroyi]|nr:TraR/DksA C4-type zinc finger protein [Ruegeria pomeroyi]NVK97118.1 TraR/DksA C4-type zinc finger protein [Ruegeria pomeroyi]NVL00438.1 TraR/DksA C4-type zinc finger protein [Ruegeria pomeroyi]QWV09093.1 TraR/DksA C4-type zinc finger protein [Ruegeria pomeroyi]HCE71173.1 molecular chaperone DnaK [Ruegeria sp.]